MPINHEEIGHNDRVWVADCGFLFEGRIREIIKHSETNKAGHILSESVEYRIREVLTPHDHTFYDDSDIFHTRDEALNHIIDGMAHVVCSNILEGFSGLSKLEVLAVLVDGLNMAWGNRRVSDLVFKERDSDIISSLVGERLQDGTFDIKDERKDDENAKPNGSPAPY
jgi:hypothetical protein